MGPPTTGSTACFSCNTWHTRTDIWCMQRHSTGPILIFDHLACSVGVPVGLKNLPMEAKRCAFTETFDESLYPHGACNHLPSSPSRKQQKAGDGLKKRNSITGKSFLSLVNRPDEAHPKTQTGPENSTQVDESLKRRTTLDTKPDYCRNCPVSCIIT